jgi:prepilin signal peptidase PulO-like enzyme (type II secretory pathway)
VATLAWKNVPVSELWRYIAGGFAVILAAWFTWLPLAVLHFFVDFIFISGAKGGGNDKWLPPNGLQRWLGIARGYLFTGNLCRLACR